MEILGYKDTDYNKQVSRIIKNEEKVISSIKAQCTYNAKSYLYRRNDPTVLKGGTIGLSRFFLESGIFVFSESYQKQGMPTNLVGPYMIISPISIPGFVTIPPSHSTPVGHPIYSERDVTPGIIDVL